MKRAIVVFGLMAIFGWNARAFAWDRVDGTYWNGIANRWSTAAQAIKTDYLRGILDGFSFMIDRADVPEGAPVFPQSEMGRVISSLDKFYGNPENVKIPVVYALSIINMELRGVDKKTIEQVVREKREFWKKAGQGE